jgi:hypothetical protein
MNSDLASKYQSTSSKRKTSNGTSNNTSGISTRSQHERATKLRRDENVMDTSPTTTKENC